MSLTQNLLQISSSAVLLFLMTVPVGLLLLRALGFNSRQWQLIPPAIVTGMLLIPLVLNTVGQMMVLNLEARLLIIVALNLGLFLIPVKTDLSVPSFSPRTSGYLMLLTAVAILWMLFPLASHGIPHGDDWRRTNATDWAKHIGVVTSLTLSDELPPPNYFLSTEPTLKYYFFAYILSGVVNQLGTTSATSLIGLAVLIAACLPFMIALWCRTAGLSEGGAVWASVLVWFGGGLDFLFCLVGIIFARLAPTGVDFWTKIGDRPIATISTIFIWLPQHAAALLGMLLIFWLIQYPLTPRRIVGIAVMLAAVEGTSIQIWIAGCAVLGAFGLVDAINHNRERLAQLAIILALSFVMSLPFTLPLMGRDAALVFSISSMGALGPFEAILGDNQLAKLLDFPIQMTIEFGALLWMGVAVLRRTWHTHQELRRWIAGLISLFLMLLILRDSATTNNFSQQLAMLVWILLAFLSGWWWDLTPKRWSLLLVLLLVIGVLTITYDEIALSSRLARISDDKMQLYRWLNQNLEAGERYQPGLESNSDAAYFVEHWVALSDDDLNVATLYAGEDNQYNHVKQTLQQAYDTSDPMVAAEGFRSLGIDFVVSSAQEPLVSQNTPGFGQFFTPVYSNTIYQVYRVNAQAED